MIAGPILPRTSEGLWNVVREAPHQLESGLELLRRDLVVEGGIRVDVLARDAMHRPVLLFLNRLDDDAGLPSRVFEARDWFARNRRMLERVLQAEEIDFRRPPRVVAVGFDFTAATLSRLRAFDAEWLSVFRVDGLAIDGVVHIGVEPLHDIGRLDSESSPEDTASMEGADGDELADFVDFVRRVDPAVRVTGDRYGRRFYIGGRELVSVQVTGGALQASVPGSDELWFVQGDGLELRDAVLRRYLDERVSPSDVIVRDRRADQDFVHLDPEITAEEFEAFMEDGATQTS